MKFKEYNQIQPWLIPPNIEDEIPSNDLVRIIDEVIEIIDTRFMEDRYSEEGSPAYHPRMLLKILLYSYARGIFSSRRIAEELDRNIFYWYLSGKQRPDFRTICLFRVRHKNDIKEIFKQVVHLCLKLGIADLNRVAIDGTKIRANASRDKFHNKEWLERRIEQESKSLDKWLDEAERIDADEDDKYGHNRRGDELPEDIQDQTKRLEKLKKIKRELDESKAKNINETDTDAKIMKSRGKFFPAYNCQVVADEKNQVILMADVTNRENDWGEVENNIEEIKTSYGTKPSTLVADSGYCDGATLQYLEREGIWGVIPDKPIKEIKEELKGYVHKNKKYKKDQFKYDKERDIYICPEGRELKKMYISPTKVRRKYSNSTSYHQYECVTCEGCLFRAECCHGKGNRRITRYVDENLREAMATRIRSKEGYLLYGIRMKTVEPIFGHIKRNLRFEHFHVRGLFKTRGEFFIIALVHNLLKIKNYILNNEMELTQLI